MEEEWSIMLSFFPDKWKEIAATTNALKGLRKEKDTENYLRTLLLHLASGYSMRETVTRAKLANIADISMLRYCGALESQKNGFTAYVFRCLRNKG